MTNYVIPDMTVAISNTGGTGDLTVDGSDPGYRSLQQAVTDGKYTYGVPTLWCVQDIDSSGIVLQQELVSAVVDSGTPPVLRRSVGTTFDTTPGGTSRLDFAGTGTAVQTRFFPVSPEAFLALYPELSPSAGPKTPGADFGDLQQRNTTGITFGTIRSWFTGTSRGFNYTEIQGFITSSVLGSESGMLRFLLRGNGDIVNELDLDPINGSAMHGQPKAGPNSLSVRQLVVDGDPVTGGSIADIGPRTQGMIQCPFIVPEQNVVGASIADDANGDPVVWFVPIYVVRQVTITSLNHILFPNLSAGNSRLAIFSNALGRPGDVIWQSAPFARPALASGANLISTSLSQTLAVGWYWVALAMEYTTTSGQRMGAGQLVGAMQNIDVYSTLSSAILMGLVHSPFYRLGFDFVTPGFSNNPTGLVQPLGNRADLRASWNSGVLSTSIWPHIWMEF